MFNHGIGLRKHQRQTGHKGSEIREEGAEPPPAQVEPEPVAPEAAPEAAPQAAAAPEAPPPAAAPTPEPAPAPPPAPTPAPPAAAAAPDDDATVTVPRPTAPGAPPAAPTAYAPQPQPNFQAGPQPSKMRETKTKLALVSKGVSRVISAKAVDAGQQAAKLSKDGADIFREALKLAFALICFLAIPTVVFFWWKSHTPAPAHQNQNQHQVFSFENGALAARSTVLKYLDHLGKGQMNEAYSLLSPSWQRDLSYASFKDAFLDIEDVRWAVSDQRLNQDGNADILVRLAYREGGKQRRFVGRFRLNRGPQGWRIDRAELSPERTS
jgi:hypothetical protein